MASFDMKGGTLDIVTLVAGAAKDKHFFNPNSALSTDSRTVLFSKTLPWPYSFVMLRECSQTQPILPPPPQVPPPH